MIGVVVGTIGLPDRDVVVAMQDEQSFIGQRGIPAFLLTVLQHEILVSVALVINNIALATILQRLHIGDSYIHRIEFDRCLPTGKPTLITGVACRLITTAVIRTLVHQVIFAHTLTTRVVYVIEVGITQTVAILMTHGANTVNIARLAIQLRTTGIAVNHQVLAHGNSTCAITIIFR